MDTMDEITIEGAVPTGAGSANQAPNMYVGAFWRADQKGERIIRIHTGTGATGTANAGLWIASVAPLDAPLWAVDDVLLDRDNLSVSELSTRGISFNSLSAPQPAENHFLPATATQLVSGTVVADDHIEFRIGLNSLFSATNTIPARYAVVVLSYANGTRWHKIFLRQGHDPDYVMLQSDAVTGTATSRANAQRFSPFNVTASNLNARVNGLTDFLPNNATRFTDFPSQAGAFFQFAQTGNNLRFAWAPVNAVTGWTATSPATYWNTLSNDHESCPRGYTLSTGTTVSFHRPSDGPIDVTATTMATAALMNQSQMRLSLYSVPPTNANAANTNSVWGYYADGFFDRRWIQTANAVSTSSPVGNDVAYIGRLFYNPFIESDNYNASIFFPAAGERSTAGVLGSAGTQGRYLSSSSNGTAAAWMLNNTGTQSNQFSGVRNTGHSIRCVVVPATPLSGVTLSSTPVSGSTMLTGETIYLTANIAPSGSHVDQYEWQYNDGSTWTTIATTTMPTYNATIAANGTNQFRVIARNSVSTVTSNIVTITGTTPVGGSAARITWEEATQRYVLTTNPRDAGLYFRYGSVVGIFSGAGRYTQDLLDGTNTSTFNAANHVTINVSTVAINIADDVPFVNNSYTFIDAAYHTAVNVKAGRGDPCRLIGLDLENIKNKTAAQLTNAEIDNGLWRLPTALENQNFSGYSSDQTGGIWWWTLNQNPANFTLGVPGGEFPQRNHVNGGPGKFLPAVGDRTNAGQANFQRTRGFFLTNTPSTSSTFLGFYFDHNNIQMMNMGGQGNVFWPVRCVMVAPPLSGVTLSSVPASGSTMLTGETIYLTANSAPSGVPVDKYEWQFLNGSTWTTIATTTLPTYNATITVDGSNQFRVIASNSTNSVTSSNISITGFTPVGGSAARITWEEATQRYVLTTDPRDAGLYFRFGSVVGIFSGAGRHTQNLLSTIQNTSPFDAATHVTINVSSATINSVADVPFYDPSFGSVIINASYHTAASVKAGRGDPCRLIGLNLNNIKNKTASQLTSAEIDNGQWRLPTGQEQRDFSGYTSNQTGNPGVWWWTQGQNTTNFTMGVAGGEFPARDHVNGGPGKFLPATGDRRETGEAGRQAFSTGARGFFLSNTGAGTTFEGFVLERDNMRLTTASRDWFWPARCVRQ